VKDMRFIESSDWLAPLCDPLSHRFNESSDWLAPTLNTVLGRGNAQTRRHSPCSNADLELCSGKVECAGSVATLTRARPLGRSVAQMPRYQAPVVPLPCSNTDLELLFGKVECAGSVATLTSGRGPAQMP